MNNLKAEKNLAVIATLFDSNSIRSVERLTGVHRDTIIRLLIRTGQRCETIFVETVRNLRCGSVQVDELWTCVYKKQARLAFDERFSPKMGDQYAFVAIDAETKLIPYFDVGKRDMVTTDRIMDVLKARLAESFRFQLTTDGFVPYIGAVECAWGPMRRTSASL